MKRFFAVFCVLVLVLALSACSDKAKSYDIGNADRARVFFNKYNSMVEEYGEGRSVDGTLHGTAVARLYDFTGDGYPELLFAYSSLKDGVVDSVKICAFDMGYAEIYNEKITTVSEEGLSLWIYTDSSGRNYVITGEDLSVSRSYLSYQKTDAQGNPLYAFAEAFDTDGKDLSGVYEKFPVKGADFKAIDAENQNVLNALETQKN